MASDQTVTAKFVLQAQLELQRLGTHKTMSLLENAEPDLTEFVLETSTHFYHEILKTGVPGKQARRLHEDTLTLVLISILSLQKAHAALWQDFPAGEPGSSVSPPAAGNPKPNPDP